MDQTDYDAMIRTALEVLAKRDSLPEDLHAARYLLEILRSESREEAVHTPDRNVA